MRSIFKFFSTDRPLLLASAILLTIATATWVNSSNVLLKTKAAPCKIASLQFTYTDSRAAAIVQSWRDADVIHIAKVSLLQDYALMTCYSLAAILLIMAFDKNTTPTKLTILFSWLAAIAGLADATENLFTFLLLYEKIHSALLIFIPAIIKWGLLGSIVIYVVWELVKAIIAFFRNPQRTDIARNALSLAGDTLRSAKIYMPGLVTVIISYFVFVKLSQGQDIILRVSEYTWPFIWTTAFCLPLWSIFCWYSARLVGYERSLQSGSIPEEFHTHVPRLIAFNSLTCIQAAIVALPTIGNLPQGAVWAFIIVQNALYFFRHKILTMNPAPKGYLVLSRIIIGLYGALVAYMAFPGPHSDPHTLRLPIAAFVLFLIQLRIQRIFIQRRKKLAIVAGTPEIGRLTIGKWKTVNVPGDVRESEQQLFNWMLPIAAIGMLVYIILPALPAFANAVGPAGIVTLSLGCLVVISNIIIIVSIHWRVNLFAILFVWAIVFGNIYNLYSVHTVPLDEGKTIVQRPKMKTYVERWLKKRKDMIAATDGNFPVYVIIADGGASRSGYWVASALSALQEQTEYNDPGNAFADHLLVLAGASGGSVGNATFYSLLKQNLDTTVTYMTSSREFLRNDFLSPVLTHWLGSDFWQHFVRLPISDRAVALEGSMEFHGKGPLHDLFNTPFSEVIDTTGCLPILFINTTNVQQGVAAVVSSIDINPFSKRIDVLNLVADSDKERKTDINFSTGVVMGARFPFVSPAGNIGKESFVDGGYFDNTGAGILHEMMQDLTLQIDSNKVSITGVSKTDSILLKKLKFQLIYLSNRSLTSSDSSVMHPLVNDAAAPIITVLGTYGSQTDINNSRLKKFMSTRSPDALPVDMNLFRSDKEQRISMNWVISDYGLRRMNQNLFEAMREDYPKIIKIPRVPEAAKCKCRKL